MGLLHCKAVALVTLCTFLILCVEPSLSARRAFVVGITDYKSSNVTDLPNASIDADMVEKKLSSAGYIVTLLRDQEANTESFLKSWDGFLDSMEAGDEVVIFYSGHGLELKSENFLAPADAPSEKDGVTRSVFTSRLISFRNLMVQLEDRQPSIQIWIIDACRVNPFGDDNGRPFVGSERGLDPISIQPSRLVMYSANYGQIAADRLNSDGDRHLGSPYTRSFVALYDKYKGRPVTEFARAVRRNLFKLLAESGSPQLPVVEDGLVDDWCFETCEPTVLQASVPVPRGTTVADQVDDSASVKAALDSVSAHIEGPEIDGNSIYLGKSTAIASCTDDSVSDAYPFGCDILKAVAMAPLSPTNLVQIQPFPVTAKTTANVRQSLPSALGNQLIYECKVGQLRRGMHTKVARVVAYTLSEATQYYGVIDGEPKRCAG